MQHIKIGYHARLNRTDFERWYLAEYKNKLTPPVLPETVVIDSNPFNSIFLKEQIVRIKFVDKDHFEEVPVTALSPAHQPCKWQVGDCIQLNDLFEEWRDYAGGGFENPPAPNAIGVIQMIGSGCDAWVDFSGEVSDDDDWWPINIDWADVWPLPRLKPEAYMNMPRSHLPISLLKTMNNMDGHLMSSMDGFIEVVMAWLRHGQMALTQEQVLAHPRD